ncbi:MAG TPA: serine hydrolase domain-containing protein [Candidatus Dormibacteraeota bacterium]
MSTAGFDEARLERITDHLASRYVQPGKIAGCQALVARHGSVAYLRSFGCADLERAAPVRDDTIWRIYSMTKPITSVALLTLYEQARFELNDPIERFLPEWRDVRVREGDGRLVAPERPITVRDLLMHTSGVGYGFDPAHPVDQLYAEADLRDPTHTLEEFSRRLAALPLKFHPGTRWHYSYATDLCGRLVEVISGRPFDQYLREVVFEPLGMVDTGFVIPEREVGRLAANYRRNADKALEVFDDPRTSVYLRPRRPSGGGGLLSTTADYHRFVEMLRRGGELDGHRVLGERTLRFMVRNHLPGGASMSRLSLESDALGTGSAGIGFGLGFAVILDPAEMGAIASPGEYFWGGAAATLFWVDPVEDLAVIFMTQLMESPFDFRGQLRQLVHQALV